MKSTKKIALTSLAAVSVFSALALASCGKEEVLHGEYEETFGKAQTVYVTKVDVTVKGDKIVSVVMSADSDHYTKESSKWPETSWTDYEAEVLKAFEGKSVSAILAAEENAVFEPISGATVTSNRIYQAVVNALKGE